jgi:site-specific DNA-methyltransferase (adenine-specific)
MTITLLQGDCLQIMPTLIEKVDACITDPPYGMKWDARVTTGKNGHGKPKTKSGNYGKTILNDDRPFDPLPFLGFKTVVMFGYNHFADKLPKGSLLVWIKKFDRGFGQFLSDAEVAWVNQGCGVWCKRSTEMKAIESKRLHTNQKPVDIMRWIIEKYTKPGETILDPFMGSGTTIVAAIQTGRNAIGIENDAKYFAIAEKRIHDAQQQMRLPLDV